MSHNSKPNRLAQEASPYLQQHALNPVDWFPWSEEALAKAKSEDKPILLSVGYSACHWCHVMERESFENLQIAEQMNRYFVNIKVDREVRPDLDQVYQLVVQLMGRGGGWPLTVFLLPDLRPFFGGTYFPPTDRYGMPGFATVLEAVNEAYRNRNDDVKRSATKLTRGIEHVLSEPSVAEGELAVDTVERAAHKLALRMDDDFGGFGTAPKFPNTMALELVLRVGVRTHEQTLLTKVERTLDAMCQGGIYDQLAGGFHRYSTDRQWLTPHFEKMLYDNALLLKLYTEAWRLYGHDRYKHTVQQTVDYVLREMLDDQGGFYCAQDADSEGQEGKFFVWTEDELAAELNADEFEVAKSLWGVTASGNFEGGANILHVAEPLANVATELGLEIQVVEQRLHSARQKLFEKRSTRETPFRDEKILVAWNALMISALAEAGSVFQNKTWLTQAQRCFQFICDAMIKDNVLYRVYKNGLGNVEGFLEDYANLALSALDLYENTFEERYLEKAKTLLEQAVQRFWDEKTQSFYFVRAGAHELWVRPKDSYDNATPSGNSSIVRALLRFESHQPGSSVQGYAEKVIRKLGLKALTEPFAFSYLLGAVDLLLAGPTEIVVVTDNTESNAQSMLEPILGSYIPNRVLLQKNPKSTTSSATAAYRQGLLRRNNLATVYVCKNRTCSEPFTDAKLLKEFLHPNL